MTVDLVLHLLLKFQRYTKQIWLSRNSSVASVVGVYVGLPCELSILIPLSSSPRNVIYIQNDIVRGLLGKENRILVMEVRQVLRNILSRLMFCEF